MNLSAFESSTMDDGGSLNHQNGVQMAPQGGSVGNNKQGDENNPKAQYSIPGILHFIQHEWARFELERSQWEVDRAELQVFPQYSFTDVKCALKIRLFQPIAAFALHECFNSDVSLLTTGDS